MAALFSPTESHFTIISPDKWYIDIDLLVGLVFLSLKHGDILVRRVKF